MVLQIKIIFFFVLPPKFGILFLLENVFFYIYINSFLLSV